MTKVFIILILGCFLFQISKSQEIADLKFNTISTDEGMPSDFCTFCFKDSEGFMWFGTEQGVVRYDGYEAVNIMNIVEDFSDNKNFTAASEDKKGNIWFSTTSGLVVYYKDQGRIESISLRDKLQNYQISNSITSIVCDSSNVMWMGSSQGLFKYHIDKDTLVHHRTITDRNSSTNILSMYIDRDHNIWITTWKDGLIKYNPKIKDFKVYRIFNDFEVPGKNNQMYSLFQDKEGYLYVGSWNGGFYILDISSEKLKILRRFHTKGKWKIPSDIVHCFSQDKEGRIWIGTPSGLSIIENPLVDNCKISHIQADENNPYSIAGNAVRSIFTDEVGTMWLATLGGGINKLVFERNIFSTIQPTKHLSTAATKTSHSFIEDHNGNILVGVKGEFFEVYNAENNTIESFQKHPDYSLFNLEWYNTALAFTKDSRGMLWIGTRYQGIVRYNPKTKKHRAYNNQNRRKNFIVRGVNGFYEESADRIWVATTTGLYRIILGNTNEINDFIVEQVKPVSEEYKQYLGSNISDILIDKEGYLWISTFNYGVFKSKNVLGDETQIQFEYLNKSKESDINTKNTICLFKDSKNRVWLGTGGDGLKYWDNKNNKFRSILKSTIQDNAVFFGIVEDDLGRLWATTNIGVIRIEEHEKENFKAEFYSKIDGLQNNLFSIGAIYKTKDGRIVVGGNTGFNIFNPEEISSDTYLPPVAITSIRINEELQNTYSLKGKKQKFSYYQNDFRFSFSALDFRYPDKIRYAYKLKGIDQDWNYVNYKSKIANYSNLPAGDYVFKVKGTNYMGIWSTDTKEISFTIKQAPYKTWWAILGYALLITGVIYFFLRLRIDQMAIKNNLEIEKVNRQKSESINQFKLQFFTNLSHELLTPLSVLKIVTDEWYKYQKDDKIDIHNILDRNINDLRDQIKKVLQFRKVESGNMVIKLKEVSIPELLDDIISNYKVLADSKGISFQTRYPKHLNGNVDPEKVEIILNNLLSNAFKYNTKGGEVIFDAEVVEQNEYTYLEFTVSDTGYGIPKEKLDSIFERFYRVDVDTKTEGLGIGLALVNNLVKLHQGQITVDSKLGSGTIFKVEIPISKSYYNDHEAENNLVVFEADKILHNEEDEIKVIKVLPQPGKTILIIEDDVDLLSLLKNSCEGYYKVLTADNGLAGYKIAVNHEVDLIVTDYMMPEMDGIELCSKVKNDVNTSHIPVVIVTADQEEGTKVLGYESGVDSIINKPINIKLLLTRIDALLKRKAVTISKFSTGDAFEPSELEITTLDEQFLEKAKKIVEEHMEDQNFSVKVMQEELGLSHSKLYRKIKGILGTTPNDYIRNIRLRRAAQLLEADDGLNISDVAFQIGFSDLSYFGVCFKKQFGVTPRDYQKGDRKAS